MMLLTWGGSEGGGVLWTLIYILVADEEGTNQRYKMLEEWRS